ncbi:MAG: leucyl aminopeptidase family protein [Jatrophihabitans endophyticus]|nr:leucyl aminopeptidase family protein [Jatrophihabitans endophyticus]
MTLAAAGDVPDSALRLDLGAGAPSDPVAVRTAAGRLARTLPPGTSDLDVSELGAGGLGATGDVLSALVEGLRLGSYVFTTARPKPRPTLVRLHGVTDEAALDAGVRRSDALAWGRDLTNTPAATATPAWLARQAATALGELGVEVDEHDPDWLAEHGFGGVLAVGNGSANPPRLIEARWRPRGTAPSRANGRPHVVLIGKGITFDTGGLDRKVGDGMLTMKTDMAGGATVLTALRLIAAERLPVRVTALVPAAENAFSGASYRPGDVVTHVGGRTSEITNTDAEGRIVLADALAWAVARLKPTALVDVATLTGAMKVALGLRSAGLFSTSGELAHALESASRAAGEPLWRMPLPVEYESLLRSDVADAVNAPGNPGAITAALFLRPFAGGVPWAHLDVAGPARAAKDDGALSLGATGFGARTLYEYVAALS